VILTLRQPIEVCSSKLGNGDRRNVFRFLIRVKHCEPTRVAFHRPRKKITENVPPVPEIPEIPTPKTAPSYGGQA
jgi:hypothetical protein